MASLSLVVDNVRVVFGGEVVLDNVSLDFRGPCLVQVLGPNGAGKTTLFRVITGLVKPVHGRVIVCGVDVTGRPERAGRLIGYVPQLSWEERGYPITPRELIEAYLIAKGVPRSEARRAAEEVLELVELPRRFWDKCFWRLSGGMRQRVLIAKALAGDPPVLVMDEPLSAVDPAGRADLAKLIGQLSRSKLVLVSCHDPTLLLPYTSYVVLLNRRVYGVGDPQSVLRLELLKLVYDGAAVMIEAGHIHISDHHYR